MPTVTNTAADSSAKPPVIKTDDALLRTQSLFALWVWATIQSDFFTLTPQADGTSAVDGWPTGDALDTLKTNFATLTDATGAPAVEGVLSQLHDNFQTGDDGDFYFVQVRNPADGTLSMQEAKIGYGVAASVTKNLFSLVGRNILPFYTENDPTCTPAQIAAMIPKTNPA